jgi:hypothetical protein
LVAERCDASICPESGEKRSERPALETTLMTHRRHGPAAELSGPELTSGPLPAC